MRLWLAATVAVLTACGGENQSTRTLTDRERDSIIAQSRLPGAGGVGAAMRAADTISARVRSTDTIGP